MHLHHHHHPYHHQSPQQQPQSSAMASPARVVFYSGSPASSTGGGGVSSPPMSPAVARFYSLIRTLNEAPQDDVKYRALKEVSEMLEDISGAPAFASLVDSLIRVFINLLQETLPQFIAENNTLQLRKLMLDLLLRMSSNERMKQYVTILQQILIQLIYMENEENALMIIKILTDHIKTFRPAFLPELMNPFFAQSKSVFNGMFAHSANEAMFLKRPFLTAGKTIEESVAEALKTCYASATLNYSQNQQYTLVPRASQSVKVLAEMSVFLFVLIQAHRQQLIREVLELIPIFVRFVNIAVPRHIRAHKLYNKELVEEFHWAQVRALSFIAYISRQSQMAPVIGENAKALSDGIVSLFDSFHDEVITQRRDLLVAIKYFFQCEARALFIGIIPKMCDDCSLLGRSFTSQDHLRNQAYSFLADILHHVRMSLDYKLLKHIFFIASRNLHDAQLLPYVQTMYGKLMMNLIEAVLVQPKEHNKMYQEVLCAAVDSLVRKAKFVAEYHLPLIVEKQRAQQTEAKQPQQVPSSSTTAATEEESKSTGRSDESSKALEACHSFWQDSCQPLALNDCKNMVRFSIQPVKMMVIALKDMGAFENGDELVMHRLTTLLSEYFCHGLKCLDIFIVAANSISSYPKIGTPSVRTKEEKDTIDAFVSTYTNIVGPLFEQIIDQHIEFLISRILANPALQHMCNSFFKHPTTMTPMGNALVKFLLSKLSELGGTNNEKASLHLMLFKLIFQTVSFSQNSSESENLLKPFLHRIVQDSMQLASTSRECTNYFLLLRALFRSIGTGTHDLLYQQFLPLLPSILQQLNRLQNGAHRQSVHELFVELCLTIPVRLSSLLPYLPLLMDPLVCALNGSPALVQQGLRTLELCVDNLQPEYLYDHMMPVRAALMSGLWRTVYASDTQSAVAALRILGKFGGSNRKALLDPQMWTSSTDCCSTTVVASAAYRFGETSTAAPMLKFEWWSLRQHIGEQEQQQQQFFPPPVVSGGDAAPPTPQTVGGGMAPMEDTVGRTAHQQQQRRFACTLPLREAVRSAVSILRSQPVTDAMQIVTPMAGTVPNPLSSPSATQTNANLPLKIQAVELIRNVLLVAIKCVDIPSSLIKKALSDAVKLVQSTTTTQSDGTVDEQHRAILSPSSFVCADKFSRDIFVEALSGLFIAVFNTETRTQILPFFKMFTKHLTVMAVLESNTGTFQPAVVQRRLCLDSSILIDAIVVTLGDACRDYCHTAIVALRLMLDTAASLFNGDREKACQLPLFSYIINKVISLCYRHEWFAHLGGCTALRMIVEQYPRAFVQRNAVAIFDGCLETISCLSGELSCGVIESASAIFDLLLDVCFPSLANGAGVDNVDELLASFVTRLVDGLVDSEQTLRAECLRVVQLLAEKAKIPLAELVTHYGNNLQEKIRQKLSQLSSASIDAKIALINFFLFFANIDGFPMELSQKELETFAQNLFQTVRSKEPIQQQSQSLDILSSPNSNIVASSAVTANANDCEATDDQQKVQLLKTFAIDALVMVYVKTVSKSFVSPRKEAELFESDSGDIDLRGPQYLMDIFEFLIRCLLNEDNESLRETAHKGIIKILLEHSRPEHSVYIAMKLEQFVEQFRNKRQFISKRFFEKLIFLSAHSTTKLSPMDLQMIGLDLSLIMKTTPSSLKVEDIECVAKALELFCTLPHKNGALLRESIEFFAKCLFNFSTELQNKWIRTILPFMSTLSVDFADVFLSRDFLADTNSHRFLIELIRVDGESADLLRKSLLNNLTLVKPLIVEFNSPKNTDAQQSIKLHLLNFLFVLLDHDDVHLSNDHQITNEVFGSIRSLWCSDSFKRRHSVRKSVPASLVYNLPACSSSASDYAFDNNSQSSSIAILDVPTMDCPALCARILLIKLRSLLRAIRRLDDASAVVNTEQQQLQQHNQRQQQQQPLGWRSPLVRESIDLVYDLVIAFEHCYASNFTFLRTFIDNEIIAKASLPWRRATFAKLIDLIPSAGHSVQLVRFVQYIVSPVFAYAFEMFDVDAVVGGGVGPSSAASTSAVDDENIVLLLCHKVIHRLANERSLVSDSLTIVMYLFCSLVVQKCPLHIYDPAKKQHGNRQEQGNLRHFMLFAWPCLQQSFHGDVTEKYAGHFLIANIIDKFSIIRTIILQVLNSLLLAHHNFQDNRDLVRKSLEILIPALPRRMPDGYFQLQTLFKKIMVEEGRNSAQVGHCLQIIVRHHKVFYNIRHQIAPFVLSALHRLFSLQLNFDTRRLMLEVCEAIIKWEQDRQTAIEDQTTMGDNGMEAESPQRQSDERASSVISESSSPTSTTAHHQQQSSTSGVAADIHKPMDKHFVDSVVTFLFRIATFVDQYSGSSSTSNTGMEHINRRAVLLLRSALKPAVFGEVATLRTTIIEKQLQLPNTEQFGTGNEQAINHQLSQVQITLDVLTNVTHHLMPKMVLDIFRPLQRAMISCISYTNSQQILRSTYNVLSKLLEKTKCSANGLDELDMLNHHIARVIQDSFAKYAGSLNNASPPMTTITLLRLMHSAQPSYLETVCLMPFINLLQRLVREHIMSNVGTTGALDQAQKLISDLLSICVEMMCTRTKFLTAESQHNVIQLVLLPLIEKGTVDKIVENIIKVAQEIVISEIAFAQQQQHQDVQQSQQQQYHHQPQQSQGVLVLVKLYGAMEQRLYANGELQRHFLNVVVQLYEQERLLLPEGDAILNKLEPVFHWGLASPNPELRNRFFAVFERRFPKGTVQRLLHILTDENWQQMGRYDWLAHVVHLLLQSEHAVDDDKQQRQHHRLVELKQCATLNNTLAQIIAAADSDTVENVQLQQRQQVGAVQAAAAEGEGESLTKQRDELRDGGAAMEGGTIHAKIASLRLSAPADNIDGTSPPQQAPPSLSVPSGAEELLLEAATANRNSPQNSNRTTVLDMQISLLSLATQLTTGQLISNLVDILHTDSALCRKTFVELFCSLWTTFSPEERAQIQSFAGPFLSSAVHLCQRDSPRAVVTCFMEAFVLCSPPIKLEPFMRSYLGSTFNCWHFAVAQLERLAKDIRFSVADPILLNTSEPASEKLAMLDCLAKLYRQLDELDQFSALWKRRSYFDKTAKCFALFQQGDFVRAREMAENLVAQLNDRLSKTLSSDAIGGLSIALQTEQRAWEECWTSSCVQLNDWASLDHFAKSEEISDAALAMESAWHLHDWNQLKDRFAQVDAISSPQTVVRSTMLQLMLNVTNFRLNKETIERQLIDLYRALITEWRRLPSIVSHVHINILNNSHLLHEISESANLLYSNLPLLTNWSGNSNNGTPASTNSNHSLNNAVKHLMKTWRNRPLTTVDQNSAWSDLFNWRLQFFNSLLRFYDNASAAVPAGVDQQSFVAAVSPPATSTATISVPLHAITQCHLLQARAFRRSNQLDMAQNELNKVNATVLIYPIDAQQKLDEQVKCLLKRASGDVSSTTKKLKAQDAILEALETIEGTSFQYMKRDQIARLMTNKGILLARMEKREEAGRAFSAAAQLELSDTAMPSSFASVWKHWANFLGNLYLANPSESSALSTGVQAMASTLEHISMVGAQKSRTSVAKLLWLLKIASACPSEKLMNAVDELLFRYVDTIQPANWLFWLNELITDVQQRRGNAMAEILKRVGLLQPQEVFCALRVELGPSHVGRYIEQYINKLQLLASSGASASASAAAVSHHPSMAMASQQSSSSAGALISGENRLFDVLDAILNRHLTQICVLNQMLDELDNFSIGPAEVTLNKFRHFLSICHFDQFTKIADLTNTASDPQLLKSLVEWLQSPEIVLAANANTDEAKMFNELLNDFAFCCSPFLPLQQHQQQQREHSPPVSVPLYRVASVLRKWVVQISAHLRQTLGKGPKRLVDSSAFLAQFKNKLASINIFDGHFNIGISPYFNTQIAQFVPLFDEVVRADSVFRLFRVRALNGKIYSYQLERVRYDHSRGHIFQLFSLLNTEFAKSRNTARRFVQFALPHVLFTGSNCRLLRCCPLAGLSSRQQNANSDHSAHNFALFTDILSDMINAGRSADPAAVGTDCEIVPLSPLTVIDQYYERLAEQRYSHKTIHELFNQICGTKTETAAVVAGSEQQHSHRPSLVTVPKDLLSRWMAQCYGDATTLWMARKKLAIQFALLGLSEHALFLSSMRPDALFLDLSTGQLFFTDYKFDLTKKVCETIAGKVPFIELDANRPVPFRLTPNISHFLGLSIDGHFIGALPAIARSLNALSLEVWLWPILWDVFAKAAEDDPQLNIVNPIKRAVDTIVGRVKALSQFDVGMGSSSQQLLVQHSMLFDNLCRMDPSWHPWF
ncbi:hypothetical protein niasHS_001311 [Heterodera schachtii]|uniref:Transformation/transcription domain-associated protein n=1 Tax=Heterodera schachtii TaxID=97005 RepID=A0ABD2KIJ5_HETSC